MAYHRMWMSSGFYAGKDNRIGYQTTPRLIDIIFYWKCDTIHFHNKCHRKCGCECDCPCYTDYFKYAIQRQESPQLEGKTEMKCSKSYAIDHRSNIKVQIRVFNFCELDILQSWRSMKLILPDLSNFFPIDFFFQNAVEFFALWSPS